MNSAIDHVFCGAAVWWPQRHRDGHNGAGQIFGTIWDTDNNGDVLLFEHGKFQLYFFTKLDDYEWHGDDQDKGILVVRSPTFMELNPRRPYLVSRSIGAFCTIKHGIRRVPVWTHNQWRG